MAVPGSVSGSGRPAVVIDEELVAPSTGVNLARPKSKTFTWPRSVTKMFAGLMSRWMIPLLWAAQSASAISIPHASTSRKRQRAARNMMFKRCAFHEFHGNERLAVLLIDFVDGADVRMIQRGGRTRFSAKTFESPRMPGHIAGQKLEGDEPAERGVLGFVDDAHASAAQPLDDSVTRDGLADGGAKVAYALKGHLVIELHQRCIDRSGALLFGLDQLLEVHPQFLILAAGRLSERCTILRVLFQGSVKERFQALPEFRSHSRFTAIVPALAQFHPGARCDLVLRPHRSDYELQCKFPQAALRRLT